MDNLLPLLYDAAIVSIMAVSIVLAAKYGAFRALSGIIGTVVGVICGLMFQGVLATAISGLLAGPVESFLRSLNFSEFMQMGNETLATVSDDLAHVIELWEQSSNGQIPEELVIALSGIILPKLAAVVSFLVIFTLTKLLTGMILRVFNDKIPVFRAISKGLGAVLGAVSGLLIILVLCWAVMHYAPVEAGAGMINQETLQNSYIGSFFCGLFN